MDGSSVTAGAEGAQQWSYYVWRAPTVSMGDLQKTLDQLGRDSWELVTASPLVKSVDLTGHEFVCIFRKPGVGLRPRLSTVSWVTPEHVRWFTDSLAKAEVSKGLIREMKERFKRSHITDEFLADIRDALIASSSGDDAAERVGAVLAANGV